MMDNAQNVSHKTVVHISPKTWHLKNWMISHVPFFFFGIVHCFKIPSPMQIGHYLLKKSVQQRVLSTSDIRTASERRAVTCIIQTVISENDLCYTPWLCITKYRQAWKTQHKNFIPITVFIWRDYYFFNGVTAPSGAGPPHFRDFTIILRQTKIGRNPLYEWSARHRDLYLTTHNTRSGQTYMARRDSNPQSQQASGRRTLP